MNDDSRPALTAVERAIAELRSIRSNDPTAALAMTTIKATIHTLESRWRPRLGGPTGHSSDIV